MPPKLVTRFDNNCDNCRKPILDKLYIVSSECYIIANNTPTRNMKGEHKQLELCSNCYWEILNKIRSL